MWSFYIEYLTGGIIISSKPIITARLSIILHTISQWISNKFWIDVNAWMIGTGSNELICLQLLYLVLKYTIISAIRDCFKRIILTWWIALRFVFVTLYLYIISQSCDKYTFWSIIFQLYELINELIRSQQGGWICDFLTSTWIEFLRSSVFNGRPCTDSDREF